MASQVDLISADQLLQLPRGVEEKALHWLSSGARLVWVVDPFQQNVTVYRSANDIRVLDVSDTLEADDLLPGWSIQIGELFR